MWQRLDNRGITATDFRRRISWTRGALGVVLAISGLYLLSAGPANDDWKVDLYARFIVGWAVSAVNGWHLTIKVSFLLVVDTLAGSKADESLDHDRRARGFFSLFQRHLDPLVGVQYKRLQAEHDFLVELA